MITPLGFNCAENAAAFLTGRSGFSNVTLFDVSRQRVKTAGQVALPEDDPMLPARARHRMDRGSRLAWHAAREALADAGISRDKEMQFIVGTSAAAMPVGEAYYRAARIPFSRRSQFFRSETYQAQRQMTELAGYLGVGGNLRVISNACASGANAIGNAFHLVRSGRANRVLAGGYDALCQLVFAGFDALQALAPSGIPRPFDAARDGLALGEGAAFLVVESEASAIARGAHILARVSGYAAATDIHHLTQPHPDGDAALATMTAACEMAGLVPADIGYINSHGTGTPLNDVAEGRAIQRWAGDAVSSIAVSSTKSSIGHLLGAAGAVEAAVCLLAIEHQFLPASLNVREADSVCTFDLIRTPRSATFHHALTNSFGFGGANATLVFSTSATTPPPIRKNAAAVMTLRITGTGAVSPAGWGAAPLFDALLQGKSLPTTDIVRPFGDGEIRTPARRVPAATGTTLPARLRRASPISKFAAGAALEAIGPEKLAAIAAGSLRCGVIFTVTNGCVNYSNRFFAEVLENPSLASPILFPETVFNAPSSHLSALIGSTAANDTLIADGAGFIIAIAQACEWIEREDMDACLVVTAEEADWLSAEALRFLDPRKIPGEGAAAILLERGTGPGIAIDSLPPPASYATETKTRAAESLRDKISRITPPDAWVADENTHSPTVAIGETMGASAGFQVVTAIAALQARLADAAAVISVGGNQQAAGMLLSFRHD